MLQDDQADLPPGPGRAHKVAQRGRGAGPGLYCDTTPGAWPLAFITAPRQYIYKFVACTDGPESTFDIFTKKCF